MNTMKYVFRSIFLYIGSLMLQDFRLVDIIKKYIKKISTEFKSKYNLLV